MVKSKSELESVINKALKRQVHLIKHEKALHPNVYLHSFERDDVWNHVTTCHTLTDAPFKRSTLLTEVRGRVDEQLTIVSSPLIVSGLAHCGKTWLLGQLPALYGDSTRVLVRFCGLTRLTDTLSSLLIGLCKQLHVMFGSPLLPKEIHHSSVDDVADLFRDVMRVVAAQSDRPVVIVLDGFDKLATPAAELHQFLRLCNESVPANICLAVSVRELEEETRELSGNHKQIMLSLIQERMPGKQSTTIP